MQPIWTANVEKKLDEFFRWDYIIINQVFHTNPPYKNVRH